MAIFFFAQVDLVFARQKPSDQGMFWYSAFPCSQIFCFNFLFTLIFAPARNASRSDAGEPCPLTFALCPSI